MTTRRYLRLGVIAVVGMIGGARAAQPIVDAGAPRSGRPTSAVDAPQTAGFSQAFAIPACTPLDGFAVSVYLLDAPSE